MHQAEPKPHCERCDLCECDGLPDPGVVESYIESAGIKPEAPIMRSAWEHGLMVWCKAKQQEKEDV